MANKTQLEIEIKTLLRGKAEQDAVLERMRQNDPDLELVEHVAQHNHYFSGDNLQQLLTNLPDLHLDQKHELQDIAANATSLSLRTRDTSPSQSMLVLKGSIGGDADHAVNRLEFEAAIDMPQAALDELVVGSGFQVLSKWYAERDKYHYKHVVVELMFSPGYGYMSEVEYIAAHDEDAAAAEATVRQVMSELELSELPGDRLARMFAHYNQHWQEYYGTRNTFHLD